MREATSRLERLFHRPTPLLFLPLVSPPLGCLKYHNVAQIDIPSRGSQSREIIGRENNRKSVAISNSTPRDGTMARRERSGDSAAKSDV